MNMLRRVFALALACLCWQPVAAATSFYGDQARQIIGLLNAGRGACFVTKSVVNPTTNVVEQAFCTCVANVVGNARDTAGNITAVVADMSTEQPCNAPPQVGPTPQQRQAAAAVIAQIDNDLRLWDQYLPNLDNYIDQWRYRNDPVYRGQADQWKRNEVERGRWTRGQLRAARAVQVGIANAPASGQPTGTPAPMGGTAPGQPMPGLLGVPMTR